MGLSNRPADAYKDVGGIDGGNDDMMVVAVLVVKVTSGNGGDDNVGCGGDKGGISGSGGE